MIQVKGRGVRWSAEEDDYLRANPDAPIQSLADAIGRAVTAVKWRRNELDLTPGQPLKPSKDAVHALAREWAPKAGCTANDIMTADRRQHVVWARQRVIGELSKRGHSASGIGKVLGLDHSSVLNALSSDQDRPCPTQSRESVIRDALFHRQKQAAGPRRMKDVVLAVRAAHPDWSSTQIGIELGCSAAYVRSALARNGTPISLRVFECDPTPKQEPKRSPAVYESDFIQPPSKARLMGSR